LNENTKLKKKQKILKLKIATSRSALESATSKVARISDELEINYKRQEVQKKLLDLEKTKHKFSQMNVSMLTEQNNEMNLEIKNSDVLKVSDLTDGVFRLSAQPSTDKNTDPNNETSIVVEKSDSLVVRDITDGVLRLSAIPSTDTDKRTSINYIKQDQNEPSDDLHKSRTELKSVMNDLQSSLKLLKEVDETSEETDDEGEDRESTRIPFLEPSDSDLKEEEQSSADKTVTYPKMTCSMSSFYKWLFGSNSTKRQSSMPQSGTFDANMQ